MQKPRVLIVGTGIAGIACARALRDAGVTARVVDRGRRPGGRMASRTINGRAVDLGAAYFTAEPGTPFAEVVNGWLARGLARPWTDTVAVAGPEGIQRHSTGPMRYAAPLGLRELVVDLARGIDIEQGVTVDAIPEGYDTVVLAMPDPQARRLVPIDNTSEWIPSIAVVLEGATREWAPFHAAFVNEHPVLTTLADDGDRRGDGAAVLVAHTTAELAREHLDDPDGAIPEVVAAVKNLLTLDDSLAHTFAHRWTFARPAAQHPEPFFLADGIGICGDAWGQRSAVSTAWASGDALGRAIATR